MQTRLAFIGIAGLCLFVGCSSGDDDSSGGSGSGGTSSATGGTGGTSGGAGMASGGSAGQAVVDCSAVCGNVQTLCAGRTDIDANWLSVCEEACNVRVQVAPDTAVLERDCVKASADCNAAVSCVASPH